MFSISTEGSLSKYLILSGVSLGLGSLILYKWRRSRWVCVGNVAQLYLYPLKAGAPMPVEEVQCGPGGPSKGMVHDRGFLVMTNKRNSIVSSGNYPKIVLVKLEMKKEAMKTNWVLEAPGMSSCIFNQPNVEDNVEAIKLWDVEVYGYDCGNQVSDWISQFLEVEGLRLIMHSMKDINRRMVRPKWVKLHPVTMSSSCVPAFADVSPFMMTTRPSMDSLNTEFPPGIQMDQRTFRPNIVVDGPGLEAWEEDRWTGEMKIGEVTFDYNKPCNRCNSTKVNPDTGSWYPDNEPLRTLKTFRQFNKSWGLVRRIVGDSPIFGMHFTAKTGGTITTGDQVWVRRTGQMKEETRLIKSFAKTNHKNLN